MRIGLSLDEFTDLKMRPHARADRVFHQAAVGYARRSTDMQERSIPDQQASVAKWAKDHGYHIVRWFIDDAISGTSAKGRNAFEQLLGAAEGDHDFQAILCCDISRFSRGGTNETGYYLH